MRKLLSIIAFPCVAGIAFIVFTLLSEIMPSFFADGIVNPNFITMIHGIGSLYMAYVATMIIGDW